MQLGNGVAYVSTSNVMVVRFSSDPERKDRGFYARFDAIPRAPLLSMRHRKLRSESTNDGTNPTYTTCPDGGPFTNDYGVLASPQWPNNYPPKSQCYYHIQAPRNKVIELNFNFFEVISLLPPNKRALV